MYNSSNRPKIPSKIKTISETIKADRSEIAEMNAKSKDDLLADPLMANLINNDLKLTQEEISENLALLLEVKDDRALCRTCKDKNDCPKTIKRRIIIPVMNEDRTLTRNYSLCSKENEDFIITANFFLLSCPRNWVNGSKKAEYGIDDFYYPDKGEPRGLSVSKLDAVKALASVIRGESDRWVYLRSETGLWKSSIAAYYVSLYARKHPGCAIASTPKLIEDLKSLSINNKSEFEKQLKRLQQCPLLMLDEFGNEYQTEYVYSNILLPLLSYRSRESLPIFFASEFKYSQISGMYASKIGAIKAEQLKNLLKDRCGKSFAISDSNLD